MFNSNNLETRSPRVDNNYDSGIRGRSVSDSYIDTKHRVNIPKIIMQTWKNKDIPDKWKISPQSIKKYMPDWKYVLMTDEDNRKFVKKYFPDFLPYYDRFPHNIQRADAVRYMWLHVFGGIYMDLDFEVKKPLDEFFTYETDVYLVASGNVGAYITNAFMASRPGCKLWLEMIEAMKEKLPWYYLGKHVEVMNTTGPVMLTYIATKSKTVYSMLPSKLLVPCSVCNLKCNPKGTYLKQLEGSSWISYDTRVYIFFMCKWKRVVVFVVFLLILLLLVLFIWWLDVL